MTRIRPAEAPAAKQIDRPITVRIARACALHPWRAIAFWLVFVAACVAAGQLAGLRSLSDLDSGVGQSGQAARMLHAAGMDEKAQESVLITPRSGRLDAGAANAAAAQVPQRMAQLPGVASIAPPVRAADGSAVLVKVTMTQTQADATDEVTALQGKTAEIQRAFPQLRVEQVGGTSLNTAVNDQVSTDLGLAAKYSLPATLLILLVAFGAIIAAGVPVLLALSAVVAAGGLAAVASHILPDSGTTSSMILLMGMAVGVDYSLFYVKRAREERALGRDTLDAIEIAAETSGHSVVVSGVAVIVAMLGLFVTGNPVFASLAIGSIIVVAIAVLGSLTVLPALLAKLGRHIDRPRVPIVWRLTAGDAKRESRLWSRLLRPALNHPGRTLAVSVLALLVLASPALGLTLRSGSDRTLPRSIPEVQTLDRLTKAFPGESSSLQVVVHAPASQVDAVAQRLDSLSARVAGDPLFADTAPTTTVSADRTTQLLEISVPFDGESAQARHGLAELRSHDVPTAMAGLTAAKWAVGGEVASNVDADNQLSGSIVWVVACVVGMTMLIMLFVFRSLVLALVTAVVNLLSTAAAFGVLALTFQNTWAEGLLGFRSTGAVVTWIPLFTFAVLFGLSMDYHVFVISRIREAAASGVPTRVAVRQGIVRSAGTVTSAAIVMVSVFGIFALLHMVEMKQLGVGLAAAVLIDALVVRAVVLPSLLCLLGERTWWPSRPSPWNSAETSTDVTAEMTGAGAPSFSVAGASPQ
ncbi:putative drug exporter of the RND superfamily [Frankineae bacterium MT45]|nr:putative drug exporter of the RND superfamily [Frankineae bacterium MT45]